MKERTLTLKNKTYLWIAIIVFTLLTIPGIMQRFTTETNQNHYETVLPYSEVLNMTENGALSIEDTLHDLHEAGLTSISIEPITLQQLINDDSITLYTTEDLMDLVRFDEEKRAQLKEEKGTYLTVPNDQDVRNMIDEVFNFDTVTIGPSDLYFIPRQVTETLVQVPITVEEDETLSIDDLLGFHIGFNQAVIERLEAAGYSVILRPENNPLHNAYLLMDLLENKPSEDTGLLFTGTELIGAPKPGDIADATSSLNDAGYYFYFIEFSNQQGLTTMGTTTNYNVVRLHSLKIDEESPQESIYRSIRAVKERNIRSLFLRTPETLANDRALDLTITYLNRLDTNMPATFSKGDVQAFETYNVSTLSVISAIIAGALFIFIALALIKIKWVKYVGLIGMLLGGLGYIVTDIILLMQAFGLILAIMGATYATLIGASGQTTIKGITLQYLKAIGVTTITVLLILALYNGNAFINGFEHFKGVTLVYAVPMVLVALWSMSDHLLAVYRKLATEKWTYVKNQFQRFLDWQVKYWHVIALSLVLVGFLYYISRTGNAGVAADFEIWFRQKLENLLYVRPRTKEFLIGLPAFVLAVYLTGRFPKLGRFVYIVGSIGFLSIVNTFSHFHIPIYISVIRTIYSLVIGYILGLILIYIFKWIEKKIIRLIGG